jgi:succinate dehydrogenase/fumarate reductase flavoprotein subunit
MTDFDTDVLVIGSGAAGAQPTGHDRGVRRLRASFTHEDEGSYLPGWMVVANSQGRRSLDEMSPCNVVEARVVDRDWRPLPSQSAAVEVTGCVIGEHYVGSGNSHAHALVFGRRAGMTVVADLVGAAPQDPLTNRLQERGRT